MGEVYCRARGNSRSAGAARRVKRGHCTTPCLIASREVSFGNESVRQRIAFLFETVASKVHFQPRSRGFPRQRVRPAVDGGWWELSELLEPRSRGFSPFGFSRFRRQGLKPNAEKPRERGWGILR